MFSIWLLFAFNDSNHPALFSNHRSLFSRMPPYSRMTLFSHPLPFFTHCPGWFVHGDIRDVHDFRDGGDVHDGRAARDGHDGHDGHDGLVCMACTALRNQPVGHC
jgi:hypothetical protein